MPKSPAKPATKTKQPPEALPNPPEVPIEAILTTLTETFPDHPMGVATGQDPYMVLIGCIISLRTKDEVTIPACQRLFAKAATPQAMLELDEPTIQQLIYPAGFYKTKAATIRDVSQVVLERFGGVVPDTIEELLILKGVGRKTANLVVGLGHGLPAICVDTHVHRICNRLGYVHTKTPEETEMALRAKLPPHLWNIINWVLVRHGQELCKPIGARCDACPVRQWCPQIDVIPRKPPKPSSGTLKGLIPSA